MQIDHIPNEKRPTNTIWWVIWSIIALGAAVSALNFFNEPSEAYFMFTALCGGIAYLMWRRLRYGASRTGHPLDDALHSNVYLPDEPISVGKEPIFGPNAKVFIIQFAIMIVCIVWIAPWLNAAFETPVRAAVDTSLSFICNTTGLCTQEAAERTRASVHQQ